MDKIAYGRINADYMVSVAADFNKHSSFAKHSQQRQGCTPVDVDLLRAVVAQQHLWRGVCQRADRVGGAEVCRRHLGKSSVIGVSQKRARPAAFEKMYSE